MMHRAVGNLRRTMYMGAGLGLLACNVQSLQKYKDSNSSPLVTDGVEISTSEFPSVVRLDLGDALCTGTFISSTTVITAAHCLESRNVVFFNRIPSSKLVKNSAYSRNSLSDDIGIAIFPQGTAPDQTNLLGRSPKPGESATIVGYGNSFYNTPFDEKGVGAGIRRKGLNTVHRLNGEIVSLKANPTAESRSICGSGDSGGPLLIEGKIAAVTSARTLDRSPPECLYVDLSGRRSQIFLQNAARQGAEIPGISAP